MKVTFFGSSHGRPEPNRRCSCALLEAGSRKYLIDVGTDPMPELITRGISPNEITAIFITHPHGDHTNGLVPFADLCSWYYKDADPLIFLPDIGMLDALKGWIRSTCNELRPSLRFKKVTWGLIFEDDTIRVTALRTNHTQNAFAYRIEAEGKKVLFTGDMQDGDGPLADYARFVNEDGFDLVIAECAHFDAMLYLKPLRAHPPKLFCINHYSQRRLESCCRLKSEVEPEIPTVLATDGLEIRI